MKEVTYKRYIVANLLLLAGAILILFSLFCITQGYYLTGDSISYLQDSMKGKILSVFIKSSPVWPPGTALFLNLIGSLFSGEYLRLQVYTGVLLLANVFSAYYLMSEFVKGKKERIFLSSVFLLTGVHRFVFLSAISEQLFILFSTLTLTFLIRTMRKQDELSMTFLVFSASLLPVTRYIGIYMIVFLTLFLIAYCLLSKSRKMSALYILQACIILWIPTGIVLFRNKLVMGTWLEEVPIVLPDTGLLKLFFQRNFQAVIDISLPLIMSVLFAFHHPGRGENKHPLLIVSVFCFVYEFALFLSLNIRRSSPVFDNFPSRYMAVIYPYVSLITYSIASHYVRRFRLLKGSVFPGVAVILLALFGILSVALDYNKERMLPGSVVQGAEYSRELVEFCNNTDNNYLLIQEYSRNHIAQSFKYVCKMELLSSRGVFLLKKGSYLVTPYIIPNLIVKDAYTGFYGQRKVYRYTSDKDVTVDVSGVLDGLSQLD